MHSGAGGGRQRFHHSSPALRLKGSGSLGIAGLRQDVRWVAPNTAGMQQGVPALQFSLGRSASAGDLAVLEGLSAPSIDVLRQEVAALPQTQKPWLLPGDSVLLVAMPTRCDARQSGPAAGGGAGGMDNGGEQADEDEEEEEEGEDEWLEQGDEADEAGSEGGEGSGAAGSGAAGSVEAVPGQKRKRSGPMPLLMYLLAQAAWYRVNKSPAWKAALTLLAAGYCSNMQSVPAFKAMRALQKLQAYMLAMEAGGEPACARFAGIVSHVEGMGPKQLSQLWARAQLVEAAIASWFWFLTHKPRPTKEQNAAFEGFHGPLTRRKTHQPGMQAVALAALTAVQGVMAEAACQAVAAEAHKRTRTLEPEHAALFAELLALLVFLLEQGAAAAARGVVLAGGARLMADLQAAQSLADSDQRRKESRRATSQLVTLVERRFYPMLSAMWKRISGGRSKGGLVGGRIDTKNKAPGELSKWEKGGLAGGANGAAATSEWGEGWWRGLCGAFCCLLCAGLEQQTWPSAHPAPACPPIHQPPIHPPTCNHHPPNHY